MQALFEILMSANHVSEVRQKSQQRSGRLVAVLGAEREAALWSIIMNRLLSVDGADRKATKTIVLYSTKPFLIVWIRMKDNINISTTTLIHSNNIFSHSHLVFCPHLTKRRKWNCSWQHWKLYLSNSTVTFLLYNQRKTISAVIMETFVSESSWNETLSLDIRWKSM